MVLLTDGYILALVARTADESQRGATTWKASDLTEKNRELTRPSIPKGETAPACQDNRKTEQRMTFQQPDTKILLRTPSYFSETELGTLRPDRQMKELPRRPMAVQTRSPLANQTEGNAHKFPPVMLI